MGQSHGIPFLIFHLSHLLNHHFVTFTEHYIPENLAEIIVRAIKNRKAKKNKILSNVIFMHHTRIYSL